MSTCQPVLGHIFLSTEGLAHDSYVSVSMPPVGHVADTGILHTHIWGLSKEAVCLSVH